MKITLLTLGLCLLSQIGMAQKVSINPDRIIQPQEQKEHAENLRRRVQMEQVARQKAPMQPEAKISVRFLSAKGSDPDKATIILKISEDVRKFLGCQMLLDSKANTYGTIFPALGNVFSSGDISEEAFKAFDYKIPVNASPIRDEKIYTAAGDADTITVAPGVYDYCIIYPNFQRGGFWFVNNLTWCRQDDISFEKGYSYLFEIMANADISFNPPCNLGAAELILPKDGKLTNAEVIKLKVKNEGSEPASNFKVNYQLNSGRAVSETVSIVVNGGDSYLHTFSNKADMSEPGLYEVTAWVQWDKDMNDANDMISGYTKSPVVSQLPFTEEFEEKINLRERWNIVDNNNDNLTWEWDLTSSSVTGMGCVTYRSVSQKEVNADDYLISDPISFAKGVMHLTFDYNAGYENATECLDILYGKSPDPQSMVLLSRMENLNNGTWKKGIINFEVEEAGDYYIAFHVRTSIDNNYNNTALSIDAILIDQGLYTGILDLNLKSMQIPMSSCDVQDVWSLGMTVGNDGTEEIKSFTLNVQIDDKPVMTQVYSDQIEAGAEITVNFWAQGSDPFSFSEKRKYTVKCWAECERDRVLDNNELVSSLRNYEPITTLPHTSHFYNEEVASDWFTYDPEAWFDYEWETYEAMTDSLPAVSRCFSLEPGSYRVKLTYKAGFNFMGVLAPENFIMMCGLSGTDPMSWNVIMDAKDQVSTSFISKEVRFDITEAGEYSLAIMTTQWEHLKMGVLSVKEVYLEKVPEHDLQLKQFSSTLSAQTPEKQLKGAHAFQALLWNRGMGAETNVKVEFRHKEEVVASSESVPSLGYNVPQLFSAKATTLPVWRKGETVDMNIIALADNNVKSKDYNFSFAVSDTVFAKDRCTQFSGSGVGADSPISFGNMFTLAIKDTLTSISVGFIESDSELPLDIKVYQLGKDFKLGSAVLEYSCMRPIQSGLKTYVLPIRVIEPGDYYFEVTQKNNYTLKVAHDALEGGFFYATAANDSLVAIAEFGNVVIRPNFGHGANVFEYDIAVEGITRPLAEGVFKTNELIKAVIVNSGVKVATNVSVHCSIDGEELTPQNITSMQLNARKEVIFTGDLSKTGTHTVKVWTVLANDGNPENDSAEISVLCNKRSTIYEMNFEECEDFSKDFTPAWTTVDVDGAATAGIEGYTFPGQFKPMGFIAFNPYETTPSMKYLQEILPNSGRRFGASFCLESGYRNDWLISPKLKLGSGSYIEFYVKSYVGTYGLESYQVLVSEGSNQIADFKNVSGTLTAPFEAWERVEIDLDDYDNKEVYVAIQAYSSAGFIFMIDDIRISTELTSVEEVYKSQAVKLYPNPVKSGELVNVESNRGAIQSIHLYDASGKLVSVDKMKEGTEVYQIQTSTLRTGLYFVRVNGEYGDKNFKLMVAE